MDGINHGDDILKSLQKTLQLAFEYGGPEEADVNNYTEMAKNVCKTEHGFVIGYDIVKEAAKEKTVETFDQVLENRRNDSHPKFKSQSSKRFTEFVKIANRIAKSMEEAPSQDTTMDEGFSQPNQLIPDIDPITKQRLERPVRNKHCNHIYGYQSVLQSVQQNPRLRCPIVGCPNKQHVKMSDLIEDEDLAIRLEQQRRT